MKNKIILISATVFFLSGCTAVKHQAMKSEADGTVLAVLDKFVKDTQAGLFSPYNIYDISGINPGLTTWDKKYPALQKWWCVDYYTEESVKLKETIKSYCAKKNGVYENSWCSVNSKPLFMVKTGTGKIVDRNSGCSYGSRSMGILAVTGEKIADQSSWVAWAK
ncbi:MAG TPA: hypothetical protein VFC74_02395, partial [Oscillospiraceae bacterium]|nr:hypothetical protein [Oscillospiraceae bacterium]